MYLRYYDFLNYVLFRSGQKFTFYKKCVHKHFTLTLKKIFIINTFDNKCGHRNGWDMNDFCRLEFGVWRLHHRSLTIRFNSCQYEQKKPKSSVQLFKI